MKKTLAFALVLSLLFSFAGCSGGTEGSPSSSASGESVRFTDSEGRTMTVPKRPKTVCLYGSYADAWLSAGGELLGVTEDAVEERDLAVGGAAMVGTVKEPNAETIISLKPDLVILNPDIAAQKELRDVLEGAGFACAYFRVDTFEDYSFMLKQFCNALGDPDYAEEVIQRVSAQISDVRGRAENASSHPTVLLIRAFSTGIKAKTDDELAGAILKDLGAHNIADDHPSMLEDLSLEQVIQADPDYIFVTTMGSEEKALGYLNGLIDKNPAWQELTAVKEDRYVVLPKDLFHYKPNSRWGESYEYLANILYP